jgi:intracellular sulfur oxidation DsrE/DsrF family protein
VVLLFEEKKTMPAKKLVLHIFHDDASSLNAASHVAGRIRQVADPATVALEVFVFGPAVKAMVSDAGSRMRDNLSGLIGSGVPVHACRSDAEAVGAARVTELGIELEYARDAFVRFALEGATVISF